MKLITAYIQPYRLNSVKESLFAAGINKMSVTNALGCGQQMGYTESYRGVMNEVNLLKKVRLDVAVNAEFVETTIDAILKGARSDKGGEIGDGKIFVTTLDDVIRIRSGERGKAAIG